MGTVSGQRSEVREAFRASRRLTGLPLLLMLAKQNGDRLVNGTGGRMVRLPPPHPPSHPPPPHEKRERVQQH